MNKRGRCRRACKYRCGYGLWPNGCDYLGITGKSRLKAVYERLGVERLNAKRLAKEPLLRPENCPVFEPRADRLRKKPQKGILLAGSMPERKETVTK